MVRVAVIGAGINGLTCAVKIKEKYNNFQVSLISNAFTPDTTGDGSGGLWYPYLLGTTPYNLIEKWGGETYRFLHELWREGGYDICMVPMFEFASTKEELIKPDWIKLVFGYQELNSKELEYFNKAFSNKYVAGQTFTTFIVTPPTMLAYLHQRFLKADGKIIRAEISSLQDAMLSDYDVIVNCTGLGAKYLVPDDKMAPIRGQIIKVKAPWITSCVQDVSSGHYIIPNVKTCILGGTHQDSYSREVDPKDTDFIMKGCEKIMPGIKHAELEKHWVGLRPGRTSVRLESEQKNGKFYIHNYGHGGSGLTLFWGCGSEVLQLLEEHINETNTVKSKL